MSGRKFFDSVLAMLLAHWAPTPSVSMQTNSKLSDQVCTLEEYLDLALSAPGRVVGVEPETKHPTYHDRLNLTCMNGTTFSELVLNVSRIILRAAPNSFRVACEHLLSNLGLHSAKGVAIPCPGMASARSLDKASAHLPLRSSRDTGLAMYPGWWHSVVPARWSGTLYTQTAWSTCFADV